MKISFCSNMQIFWVHGWEAGGPGRIVGVWTREWEHFDFQVDAWWSRPAGWGVGGASLVDKVVDMVAKMVAEMEVDIVADMKLDTISHFLPDLTILTEFHNFEQIFWALRVYYQFEGTFKPSMIFELLSSHQKLVTVRLNIKRHICLITVFSLLILCSMA